MIPFRPVRAALPVLALASTIGQLAVATDLDTIVVTASRRPIEIERAGASVTVLDRDFIERRQLTFVSELLRAVPGIAVGRSGGIGKQTQVRMRGAESNQVMVLIDGVEANDIAGSDEFDFGRLTTADIDRIEIVRGPQSSLWGSDALAGVINIITRKPASGYDADMVFEGGSFATTQQRVRASFGGARQRFAIGVARFDSGGTNVSYQGNEDDAYHALTIDLNGSLQPVEALELGFNARFVDDQNQFDETNFSGRLVDSPIVTASNQSYVGTHATLSLCDGHWVQHAEANWTATDNHTRRALFGGDTTNGSDRYEVTYQSTALFDLDLGFATRHRATLAVDHEYQRFVQQGLATIFGDPNQRRGMHTTGIVGEYHVDVGSSVTLGGSVRRDINSDYRDVTTYRSSIVWRMPWTGTTLSAAYGTGQKAPTFYDRFGYASGGFQPFVGNPRLRPEWSRAWEVGLARAWFAKRLQVDLTWFEARLEDEINGFYAPPGGAIITAVNRPGESRRAGLEVAANAVLPAGFSLATSYTYLDATEPDQASGRRVDEIRRPRHQGSLALDWTSPAHRWRGGVFVTHTGASDDIAFLPPTFNARVRLDGFTLLGFSGSLQAARGVELFARIENALDEDYAEVFGYRAAGLAAYAGLRIDFFPD